MNRQDVETIITAYLKPLFGFALKRCKSIEDAEDLSQEIAVRAFCALIAKDDVADMGKFIWTVAHNTLSNYYRDHAKAIVGVSIDDVAELLADPRFETDAEDNTEAIRRLQSEIAYLSKLQRRIVIAYYFENRKQADIAKELNIPLGTVKWHLFEAKKDLKRGMDMTRKTSELKFNPIHFDTFSFNGSAGEKNPHDFVRSALAQNICYCVRNMPKTIHEIADDLGVSPVYVETEAEYLEEYGFLLAQKDKYLTNFIINEPTAELLIMQDAMYKHAAKMFANDLYDELIASGLLEDDRFMRDTNFLLWALIPYIIANAAENEVDHTITFGDVATMRPDGAWYLCQATVLPKTMVLPDDYVYMKNWCGPMWNGNHDHMLWQIDSQWSEHPGSHLHRCAEEFPRVLSLYEREAEQPLAQDEYAWLIERGYVRISDTGSPEWMVVILKDDEIKQKLLAIGEQLKQKYQEEFDACKAPYNEAVLSSLPAHVRKMKEFELQYTFHSDGWFLLHCLTVLLENGKLQEPTNEQKQMLTTVIAPR